MKKNLICCLICFAVLSLLSCSMISPKDYESVKGKRFYLSKMHFYNKGARQASIFASMNDMQIPKIMTLLEHKYGIVTDYSEFDLFLYNKDPLKLRTEGLLSNADFYWESESEYPDNIEIDVLLTETSSAMSFDRDYTISIKVDKSSKVKVQGSFAGEFPVIAEIASRLDYSKTASENIYINKDTLEEVDLSSGIARKAFSPEEEAERNYLLKRGEMISKVQKDYDSLSPAQRERYINDMRDYLNKLSK